MKLSKNFDRKDCFRISQRKAECETNFHEFCTVTAPSLHDGYHEFDMQGPAYTIYRALEAQEERRILKEIASSFRKKQRFNNRNNRRIGRGSGRRR